MNKPDEARLFDPELQQAECHWQKAYDATAGGAQMLINRSGIEIKPLTRRTTARAKFFR